MRPGLFWVVFAVIVLGVALAVAPRFYASPELIAPLEASSDPAPLMPVETLATDSEPEVAVPSVVTSGTVNVYLPSALLWHDSTYVSPMGISMYGPVDPSAGLTHMKDAGAKWVVTFLRWAEVQPTGPTDFIWAATDAKFANAEAAGLRIYAVFDINPGWVTDEPRGPVPADKLDELEAMIAAMAIRYNGSEGRPRVDHWSFYGEPDNEHSWGNHGAQYAEMLKRVAPIIYAHNPNAVVTLSGLAYDKFTDDTVNPPGRFVRHFITETLQTLNNFPGGAGAYLDQVGFNYYPISLPRWPTIREKTNEIRSIMANHGVGHLPIVVTEMSMWSYWPEQGLETQAQQAHYLVHFYVRGLSVGVRQLYWFQVFDVFPEYSGSAQGLFKGQGAVDNALSQPKQSYFAYKTLARELDQAHFSRVLNVPGAEGYVFRRGTAEVTVVWGSSQTPAVVDFMLSCARRTSVLGAVSQIADGAAGDLDGSVNGRVRLQVIFEQPVYVTRC